MCLYVKVDDSCGVRLACCYVSFLIYINCTMNTSTHYKQIKNKKGTASKTGHCWLAQRTILYHSIMANFYSMFICLIHLREHHLWHGITQVVGFAVLNDFYFVIDVLNYFCFFYWFLNDYNLRWLFWMTLICDCCFEWFCFVIAVLNDFNFATAYLNDFIFVATVLNDFSFVTAVLKYFCFLLIFEWL